MADHHDDEEARCIHDLSRRWRWLTTASIAAVAFAAGMLVREMMG